MVNGVNADRDGDNFRREFGSSVLFFSVYESNVDCDGDGRLLAVVKLDSFVTLFQCRTNQMVTIFAICWLAPNSFVLFF